jgi:hypothetical protein
MQARTVSVGPLPKLCELYLWSPKHAKHAPLMFAGRPESMIYNLVVVGRAHGSPTPGPELTTSLAEIEDQTECSGKLSRIWMLLSA